MFAMSRSSRHTRLARAALWAAGLIATSRDTRAADPFGTTASLGAPAQEQLNLADCPYRVPSMPLRLTVALERSICVSPKTRGAWVSLRTAAAALGQSESLYLPTLSATGQYAREHAATAVGDSADLNSSFNNTVTQGTISLQWLLLDFGSRAAEVQSSRYLLAAAQATQEVTLQELIAAVARDFYATVSASARVRSTREVEDHARQTLDVAAARVQSGVSPITDRLQARTSLAQAVYERSHAEHDLHTALGVLAIDMDLSTEAIAVVDDLALREESLEQDGESVRGLIDNAVALNPNVRAAQDQWHAAVANTQNTKRAGLPSILATGQMSYNDQPVSASLGQIEHPAITRDRYIGLQVKVPLFEGFSRTYQIEQAERQEQAQAENLRDTKQRVSSTVWADYQTLLTAADNIRNTKLVSDAAREALAAMSDRYRLGVAGMVEMLNAQSQWVLAEQQRVQALVDWHNARVQLSLAIGTLSSHTIEPTH
jgi:outer membrane protein